jgi:predicted Zn-ribbon and HTH transcriptional regulator
VIDDTIRFVNGSGTRRQRIVALLIEERLEFEELRATLDLTVKLLADDLRHVKLSVKASGLRLRVEAARCRGCGFRFERQAFHPPGRCPQCRDYRIQGPWFRVS